jgi:hypothetical protein
MRHLMLLLALIASATRAEDAKPFNPSDYPPGVQTALRYANEECTSQDGGEVSFAPATVRKTDLTGDGRDDYVVDFSETKCGDRQTTYCGTGGCVMNILVTLPDGSVRKVFDGYVRSYTIMPPAMKRAGPRASASICMAAFAAALARRPASSRRPSRRRRLRSSSRRAGVRPAALQRRGRWR